MGYDTVVPYYLQHTLWVILAFRPAPQPGEGGGQPELPPSPILPRWPSSLSPCVDSDHIGLERKHLFVRGVFSLWEEQAKTLLRVVAY